MEQAWLIWSNEHKSWWAPDSAGYTRSRKAAGRYTRAEAVEICTGANKVMDDDHEPYETMVQDV